MGKLTIIGNNKPLIGQKEMYSVSLVNELLNPFKLLKNPLQVPKTHWEVMVETKTGWRKGGSDKEGQMVPFTFGQKSLLHKGIKIIVRQGEDYGELFVHPQRAKESKITKVELLDANYKPIPKGRKISYKDTITVRAYCVEMFGMQIAFTLWEDDAQGAGHNPIINAFNKINPIPVFGRVNEKGIAEAVFRLPFYTMAVLIANSRTASGDKDEGATHEYYVTADVVSKSILKASPNVNVINPAYDPTPPRQRRWPTGYTPPPEKPIPESEKPRPKPDSPKFPVTTGGKKSNDLQGKILSAEFVDNNGNRLHSSKVGTTVRIKIVAKEMKGKKVKVKIWEEDNFTWTHDMIFEKDCILIGDNNYINNVQLTKKMFDKAKDGGSDSARQDYFIEVIHHDTSVKSPVMPVTIDAELTEVPSGNSPVMVKEPKQGKTPSSCICQQYDLVWGNNIGCNERKKVIEVAKNLNIDPNWLMTVMALETIETFRPSIDNGVGYVGLIQFGKDAAVTINTTQDKLIKMSFVEQMFYVEKHLSQNRFKNKFKTLTDLYLAVLYPTASGHGSEPNYVVLHGAAYRSNPLFFKEKGEWEWAYKTNKKGKQIKYKKYTDPNGNTYVWEVAMVAQEVYDRGNGKKEDKFTCGVNKEKATINDTCTKDGSQCFEYNDVIENPKINDQSGIKNHNRYRNEPRKRSDGSEYYHTGTDILTVVGTKVHTMMCGEVVHTRKDLPQDDYVKGYESKTSYGNSITIKSKDKEGKIVYHFYAHLSKVNVKVGQKVKHGEVIGLSGSTGNAMHVDIKYRHVHVEAGTSYSTKGGSDGKQRCKIKADLNPENYMKSKFDKKGNTL
ncbi:M23 family metallopeptidase [Chryseobacterium sp. Marseille-Q3244]|uniref:M23 family metallopeptidase n=1 Tax=Chryseobacterium sp. Marseille-Q3244 TaxID=2758092 RepID=UPI0020242A4A|nr:M23 family metallopeptidase [Chryseobacterium sp. Marseille-Q3244]